MIHPHNKKSGQRQERQQILPVCGAKIRDRQQAPAEDSIYDPDADSHDHCKDSVFQLQDWRPKAKSRYLCPAESGCGVSGPLPPKSIQEAFKKHKEPFR